MKKNADNLRKLAKIKDEEWLIIDGTENLYAVSNYGRIKSFVRDREKGRIMKISYVKGFACVNIKRNGSYRSYLVHKLVAELFIPKPSAEHTFVCHVDLSVKNNHAKNLAWITREENYKRVIQNLNEYNKSQPGKFAPYTKLKPEDVRHIKGMLQLGVKQKVIAKMFCVSEMQITRIKNGVNWAEIDVETSEPDAPVKKTVKKRKAGNA